MRGREEHASSDEKEALDVLDEAQYKIGGRTGSVSLTQSVSQCQSGLMGRWYPVANYLISWYHSGSSHILVCIRNEYGGRAE